jgi:hypothetical protein
MKFSVCCGAEVKYRARGISIGRGMKVPHECLKCGKGCNVTYSHHDHGSQIDCTVGCPLYSSGHSINADGHCNMGCC